MSQSRTKLQAQCLLGAAKSQRRLLRVRKLHNVSPSPNPKAVWKSQSVAKSLQAQAPMPSGKHKVSQSHTGSQTQHSQGATKRHKVKLGPNSSASWKSEKLHEVALGRP